MRYVKSSRYWIALLGMLALLLTAAMPGAVATEGPDRISAEGVNEPVRLIVELMGVPLSEDDRPTQVVRIANEQATLRSQLQAGGVTYKEWGAFQKLFNGLAITVPASRLGQVKSLPGVKRVYLARKVNAPVPQLASSVDMIGARRAWAGDPALAIPGVDGSGVRVAIIDTGIDYTHPDLGGGIGPDYKVIYGYDLVGDTFNGVDDPKPDTDPMDQRGHGTHVAGIVGARAASDSGVTGVAPGVSLVALKIFGPEGSTWDDIILAALEMAYDLQVDVVNLSVGAGFLWPESPTAQAVTRLNEKGVFVASSAGNNGDAGEFATGAPAVGRGAVAAASVENDFVQRRHFLDPAGTAIGYDVMVESPNPPDSGQSPELVYAGLGAADEDFRDENGNSKVTGKVALISRGAVSFLDKSLRAQAHGAVAAIIFNNQPGAFMGTLQVPGNYIPTISILQSDGQHLRSLLDAGQTVKVTWTGTLHSFPNETAGQISTFSSWGPAPDLSIKPDVTTPGGSIYSTYPISMGGYATMSGTSMAAPHLAGAAALLLDAKRAMFQAGGPKVKMSALRNLLLNTATPLVEDPDAGALYPVHRQGAGLIDVWKAIAAKQRIDPEKIALGEVEAGQSLTRTMVIENLGDVAESYTFEAIGAAGSPAVGVSASTLTVKAGRTGKTNLKLTVPAGLPDGTVFSGWVRVKNSAGDVIAHIPYLGFMGDYQAATTLEPMPPFNFPWLARLWGPFLFKASSLEIHPECECDDAAAWVVFSLARQVQKIRVEIWEPSTGKKWGNVFEMDYLWRSNGSIEVFGWDATNDKGRRVPAGTYVLRLLLLRPLGNPNNPAHWDEWVSGPITVIYD